MDDPFSWSQWHRSGQLFTTCKLNGSVSHPSTCIKHILQTSFLLIGSTWFNTLISIGITQFRINTIEWNIVSIPNIEYNRSRDLLCSFHDDFKRFMMRPVGPSEGRCGAHCLLCGARPVGENRVRRGREEQTQKKLHGCGTSAHCSPCFLSFHYNVLFSGKEKRIYSIYSLSVFAEIDTASQTLTNWRGGWARCGWCHAPPAGGSPVYVGTPPHTGATRCTSSINACTPTVRVPSPVPFLNLNHLKHFSLCAGWFAKDLSMTVT